MATMTKTSYRRPEGHYREVRPGVWRVWFNVNDGGTRKQRTKTIYGTADDASHALHETLSALHTNDYSEPNKVTVTALLDLWLNVYATTKRPSTFTGYKGIVKLYLGPELGHILVTKLTPIDIETMYAGMTKRGLAGRTVLHTHRVLQQILKFAIRRGFIKTNPAGRDYLDAPTANRIEVRALTKEERQRFLSGLGRPRWISSPWYAPFLLAYQTGMRRGELMGLKWDAVDLDRRMVDVIRTLERIPGKGLNIGEPKSDTSRRSIKLPASAVSLLTAHKARQAAMQLAAGPAWQDDSFVFAQPDGRPRDPDAVTKAFRELMIELGITNVHLHTMRHTHATVLLEQGVHLKVVQMRLGHSSIAVTADYYSSVAESLDGHAAEAFDEASGL